MQTKAPAFYRNGCFVPRRKCWTDDDISGVDSIDVDIPSRPNPLVFPASSTAVPVKIPIPFSSCRATGSSCHETRSLLNRVAPTHVAPLIAERIVLKEEVIFAFEKDQAIGIVGPVLLRRKMKLRAVELIVGL